MSGSPRGGCRQHRDEKTQPEEDKGEEEELGTSGSVGRCSGLRWLSWDTTLVWLIQPHSHLFSRFLFCGARISHFSLNTSQLQSWHLWCGRMRNGLQSLFLTVSQHDGDCLWIVLKLSLGVFQKDGKNLCFFKKIQPRIENTSGLSFLKLLFCLWETHKQKRKKKINTV